MEFESLVTTISTRFINLDPEEIDQGIEQALKEIGEFAGVDRSCLFLISEDGKRLSNTHEWCVGGIEPQIEKLKDLPVESLPWWMERLRKREIINVEGVDSLPPEAEAEKGIFLSLVIKALIAVPIVYRDSLVGFLGFCSEREEKTWEYESITLLRMVGEIFIDAMERNFGEQAAIYQQIGAGEHKAQRLDDIVQAICSYVDDRKVWKAVLKAMS